MTKLVSLLVLLAVALVHHATADESNLFDPEDLNGTYSIQFYEDNCFLQRGALMLDVDKNGIVSGGWSFSEEDKGDTLKGNYYMENGKLELFFGGMHNTYSLWGLVNRGDDMDYGERELFVAGRWLNVTGWVPPTEGAFQAKLLGNN